MKEEALLNNHKQLWLLRLMIVMSFGIYFTAAAANSETNSVSFDIKKLAVMNFDNHSPDGQWQWLSKGLADMIITDLSASERLRIIERERLNQIIAEHELIKAGLVDSSIAGQVGQIAKVEWVLFGSFLKEGSQIKIEAHILDLKTEELIRVERVEGKADDIVLLEKRLVQKLLSRLDTPITGAEKRSIMYIPTDSIPALEHYCKSLDLFDNGKWYDSLLECRLAVSKDTEYIQACSHVARLYYELKEPEHALVEYQDIVKADHNNTFPEHIYFRMGQLLEDQFKEHQAALILYKKILQRHPELQLVFDEKGNPLDDPPVVAISQENPRYSLGALDRIAAYHHDQNNKVEAAKIYWQIYTIMLKGKMERGVLGDLRERSRERYDSLYKQLVMENRNSIFAPCYSYFHNKLYLYTVFPIPPAGGMFTDNDLKKYYISHNQDTGYAKFIAPKDKEIAEVIVTVNTDTAELYTFHRIQIDCTPDIRKRMPCEQFHLKTGKKSVRYKLDPGNRQVSIGIVGKNAQPEYEIRLRDFTRKIDPDSVRILFHYNPSKPRNIFIDGEKVSRPSEKGFSQVGYETYMPPGNHRILFEWYDGTTKSRQIKVLPSKINDVYIYPDLDCGVSRHIASEGTWTNLFIDRKGKIWLLWDQSKVSDVYSSPDENSDIYYATSNKNGIHWESAQKIPLSSSETDTRPILQQDSKGTYWLLWCSSRDPDVPQSFWISSSPDGSKWSFPRKIDIPFKRFMDKKSLHDLIQNGGCFAIDNDDNFWIFWLGCCYKSLDTYNWQELNLFKGGPDEFKMYPSYRYEVHPEYVGYDHTNQFMFLQRKFKRVERIDGRGNKTGKKRGITTRTLWLQRNEREWTNLGDIVDDSVLDASFAISPKGIVIVYSIGKGIFVRCYNSILGWSKAIQIENHFSQPKYPTVTVISEEDVVIAYSSKEGVTAKKISLGRLYDFKKK